MYHVQVFYRNVINDMLCLQIHGQETIESVDELSLLNFSKQIFNVHDDATSVLFGVCRKSIPVFMPWSNIDIEVIKYTMEQRQLFLIGVLISSDIDCVMKLIGRKTNGLSPLANLYLKCYFNKGSKDFDVTYNHLIAHGCIDEKEMSFIHETIKCGYESKQLSC